MSWILFILFGLVIGLLARALVPGRQNIGIVWTLVLGVGGALLGGWIAQMITGSALNEITLLGFIGSVIGAVVLLLAYLAIVRRKGHEMPRARREAH